MTAAVLCSNCWFKPPKALGLCPACHEYERTNGVPRPAELILRQIDREIWYPRGT